MKTKTIFIIAILLAFLVGGCIVKSLHPFYSEKDRFYRPELVGTWMDQDSMIWTFSQNTISEFMGEPKKDDSYEVVLKDPSGKEKESWFRVNLFKLKDATYFDFLPYHDENIGDHFAALHFVPAHSVARVEFYGTGNFSFVWYDEDWLNELFEQNRIKISHEEINTENSLNDQAYILTASTRELQKFLMKYGGEIDIFRKIDREKVLVEKSYDEIFRILESEINKSMEKDAVTGNDLIFSNLKKIDD
ncbi:MAG: hypothetical protein ACOCWA_09980 [Bacteroidota bacterium]